MVGHTGSFDAAVKAVETVDKCLGEIVSAVRDRNGALVVTADHGNSDQMIDYKTKEPHTFHTTHPVPLFIVGDNDIKSFTLRNDGALCDIAPTVCELLGIPVAEEMTGVSLIKA
jgi:2,3-bisphosphoglycerate-independent phosphoglycerate mutase